MKRITKLFMVTLLTIFVAFSVSAVHAKAATTNLSLVLQKGAKVSLAMIVSDGSAVNGTWSSNKKTVATVDSYGNVTAKNYGLAKITAKYDNKTHVIYVRVAQKVSKLTLNKTAVTITKGKTYQLKATLSPSKAFAPVKWTSSNKSIATVSSKGLVTGKAVGKATITANANGKTAKCVVTVKAAPVVKYTYKGKVANALTGAAIPSVSIKIRKGQNTKTGTVYASTSTSSAGEFSTKLEKGYYTVACTKSGFITTYTNIYCTNKDANAATNTNYASISMSPNQLTGNIRIVLTWGETPRDLDSHLIGPNGSGSNFHIYFGSKRAYTSRSQEIANLDLDDTTSYGPETITLNNAFVNSGTYRYYVKDYTNRYYSTSSQMSYSYAKVTVYRGNTQIASFNVPRGKAGTIWNVFNIVNGRIVPVNTVNSIEPSPYN